MIDDEKVEKVSHIIDEVLMHMSHTYELETLELASLVLARCTLMCDETNMGKPFRSMCDMISKKTVEELTDNETKVD